MRPSIIFVTFFIILFSSSSSFAQCPPMVKTNHTSSAKRAGPKPAVPAPRKAEQLVLNIDDFGAKADGISDNFQVI